VALAAGTSLAASATTRARWALVALLSLAIFINYIDRGNLATAAPLIQRDLGLTTLQIGLLTSAFFWTYVPGQMIAGWLVDRLGGHLALTLGFALWSLATALTGLAGGFVVLVGLRVLLGLGETVAFPALSKLFAEAVPPSDLGLVNSIAVAGISLGPGVGVLAGGFLIAALGWRPMFFIFGAIALLWLLPWSVYGRARAGSGRTEAPAPPAYRAILSRRVLWGATLGHFCNLYGLYFVLSWMPLWLVGQRGYSVVGMAKLLSVVYTVTALGTIFSGWLCDRLIRAGYSINGVRKSACVIGHLGGTVGLLGCALADPHTAIASLFLGAICLMMVQIWPVTQILAGARAAGRWVGVQNCLANTAGIIGPTVTGWIVDRTGSFDAAFVLAAGVVLVGALGWGVVLTRVEPVAWASA